MAKKIRSQELRLKKIDTRRTYLTEEIEWNQLMIKKHKKVCKSLNYIIWNFPILASTIAIYISIYAFTSLVTIPIGITGSAIKLKICAMTGELKSIGQ